MADENQDDQLVDLDDGRFLVTKNAKGEDVAVPVDDNFALAEIKKAEATIVAEREQTARALDRQKTNRLTEITGTIIVLAIIATCALT